MFNYRDKYFIENSKKMLVIILTMLLNQDMFFNYFTLHEFSNKQYQFMVQIAISTNRLVWCYQSIILHKLVIQKRTVIFLTVFRSKYQFHFSGAALIEDVYNDIGSLIKDLKRPLNLTSCLHPSEFDRAPTLLLCRSASAIKADFEGHNRSGLGRESRQIIHMTGKQEQVLKFLKRKQKKL